MWLTILAAVFRQDAIHWLPRTPRPAQNGLEREFSQPQRPARIQIEILSPPSAKPVKIYAMPSSPAWRLPMEIPPSSGRDCRAVHDRQIFPLLSRHEQDTVHSIVRGLQASWAVSVWSSREA